MLLAVGIGVLSLLHENVAAQLAKDFSVTKVLAIAVNLAVVGYLVFGLRERRN